MRWKDYPVEVNPDLLHEEIEEQVLGAIVVVPDDLMGGTMRVAHYRMFIFDGLGVRIETDHDLDFDTIDGIIAAHDKLKKSKNELALEQKEIRKETVLSKLGITKEELKDLVE